MTVEKLDLSSPDLVQGNIEKIAALFPNVVTEGPEGLSIDFDALRQELSDSIVDGPQERYRLDWPGKRSAMLAANTPISKTLRPAREESVDFDTTQNLFIEGDNLDALKLLQDSYLGKVKMIYIDPPYNTGKDFIYKDNFTQNKSEYLEESGQVDEDGGRLVTNPESYGRYHSDWLSMMYPRLKLARNLMRDDGVIFISIDDNEQASLRKLCDVIFGRDNFIATISRVMKSGGAKGTFFTPNVEFIHVYSKNKGDAVPFRTKITAEQIKSYYNKVETQGPRKGEKYGEERIYLPSLDVRPNQRYWIECPDGSYVIPPGETLPSEIKDGSKILPASDDGVWRWTYETYKEAKEADRIIFKKTKTSALVDEKGQQAKYNLYFKLWLKDQQEKGKTPGNLITKYENRQSSKELRILDIPFDFAKPTGLIKYLLEIVRPSQNDIILDFFAGSSSSIDALFQANSDGFQLNFIAVQLPENVEKDSPADKKGYTNIAELSKERIRRAGAKILEENPDQVGKLDIGFRVLKIDSSNMKDVHVDPRELKQGELLDAVSHIKADRSGEDLLFQVMLKQGIKLSQSISRETVEGKTVYIVGQDNIIACFDNNITDDIVKDIASRKPLYAIFRDESFKEPADKINAAQIFKQLTEGHTRMKVI